jgi:hypothetical protein
MKTDQSHKNDLVKNLTDQLEIMMPTPLPPKVLTPEPSNEALIADAQDDFEYARMRMKKLLDTSDEVIGNLHALATDAEHPRAYEVLGNMIKQSAEMNQQLLDLQKQRKALIKGDKSNMANSTTNNAIFVGTTTELQKFLKDQASTS